MTQKSFQILVIDKEMRERRGIRSAKLSQNRQCLASVRVAAQRCNNPSHRRPSTPAKSSRQLRRAVQQAANSSGKPRLQRAALQTRLRIAAHGGGRLRVQILLRKQLQLRIARGNPCMQQRQLAGSHCRLVCCESGAAAAVQEAADASLQTLRSGNCGRAAKLRILRGSPRLQRLSA